MEITINGDCKCTNENDLSNDDIEGWTSLLQETRKNLSDIWTADSGVRFTGERVLSDRVKNWIKQAQEDEFKKPKEDVSSQFYHLIHAGFPLPLPADVVNSIMLSIQVKNFSNKASQRADGVALTETGELGMFEFKSTGAKHPANAVLQAVCYAACLCHSENWNRMMEESRKLGIVTDALDEYGFEFNDDESVAYVAVASVMHDEGPQTNFPESKYWNELEAPCRKLVSELPGSPELLILKNELTHQQVT